MAITTQALRVQILTSAPSLAFSMFLSFRVLCVKSGGGPLNRANHPGIQSLNDRCLGSLGVHPRECLGLRRRATASSAFRGASDQRGIPHWSCFSVRVAALS